VKLISRTLAAGAVAISALVAFGCHALTISSTSQTLPACPTGTGSAKVRVWSACGGADVANAVHLDVRRIGASDGGTAALLGACGQLRLDVRAARDFAPIPDRQAQAHWSVGLDILADAAKDCLSAARSEDGAALTVAGHEMAEGGAEIGKASDRLEQIQER
jgi:hypothetical protein